MKYQEITSKIIKCAYTVHKNLGFGFLENVYQNALMIELTNADLEAEKEKKIQVLYHGQVVGDYIADIVVENKIICELKSTKEINPAHEAQLVNYLKATGMEIGLLINFGEQVRVKRKILDKIQET
jgi:GxxExxY protein